jgi:hypothetical protein
MDGDTPWRVDYLKTVDVDDLSIALDMNCSTTINDAAVLDHHALLNRHSAHHRARRGHARTA